MSVNVSPLVQQNASKVQGTVLEGMPSFLFNSSKLQFDVQWPTYKILPSPVNYDSKFGAQNDVDDIIVLNESRKQSQEVKMEQKEKNIHFETRKVQKITNCPHSTRKHYAKKMCSSCYHERVRKGKAYACGHPERTILAKGLCSKCYQVAYKAYKSQNLSK